MQAETTAEFRAQVDATQRLVSACAVAAASCDPGAVPGDTQVSGEGGGSFRAGWLWLREALGAAKEAKATERTESMRQASEHLAEVAQEAGRSQDAASFGRAHAAAAEVLARGEFQAAAGPTWLDRQTARLQEWFLQLLLGMDRIGSHNPWLAPAMEWICFLLAAGGLVFFIRRSLARQALRVAFGSGVPAGYAEADATDWAREAEDRAGKHEWREAVHCLYWAAITLLESRRLWRPNPTRTPREYLRLLPPNSAARESMGALTRSLEAAWYGRAESTEAEFLAARASFEQLASANVRRDGPAAAAPVPMVAT